MKRGASVEKAYKLAAESYGALGVDTDSALEKLSKIPVSLHSWQGDDLAGFESGELSGGGILATGSYPGRARTAEEMRGDLEEVFTLVPGRHRVNLHAIHAETGGKKVERNGLRPEHFAGWIDWAKEQKLHGLDFNPTFFSHPLAADGFTLSHADAAIRKFWVEHATACRKIAESMGKKLGTPSIHNTWIPDGYKDIPVDRLAPRQRLCESLDAMLKVKLDPKCMRDAVESKLFGIGSESYVVGSHEFYLGYAITRKILLCMDAGHYHPTETLADKISSTLSFVGELLLHVSRPVRWDSDHVVILDDALIATAQELVRGRFLDRVHIGLDFFDASINRIAAWTIGMRSMLKALLLALLEPLDTLAKLELKGDLTGRLAMLEELKTLPFAAVWDYYCAKNNVPVGKAWLDEVRQYETDVLSRRVK